jgi:hypothetical protein
MAAGFHLHRSGPLDWAAVGLRPKEGRQAAERPDQPKEGRQAAERPDQPKEGRMKIFREVPKVKDRPKDRWPRAV